MKEGEREVEGELNPYLYSGLEASLYDVLDELSEFDDAHFFRWFIENYPGPVLDVGCGTGRLLIPYAKEGIDIEGIDTSNEMLDICRDKLKADDLGNRISCADMRDFDLDRKYQVIMIPGFSIQLLREESEAIACLENCRKHLMPGGILIVCSYIPWDMVYDGRSEAPYELRKSCEDLEQGQLLEASQGWVLDREKELLVLKNRFEVFDITSKELLHRQDAEMVLRWRLP